MKNNLIILSILLIFYSYILYRTYSSIKHNNFSKNSAYHKNFIDWIVYILALIVTPFLLFTTLLVFIPFRHKLHEIDNFFSRISYKNWEEIRRLNLYVFVFFSTVIGLVFLLIKISGYFEKLTLPFYLISVVFLLCILGGLLKLMYKYEKHIELKLFIPGSNVPAPKLKKEYKKTGINS